MLHGIVHAFADFSYGTSVLPSLEEYRFRDWMRKHSKSYNTREEYALRFEVYKKHVKKVEELKHKR